MLLLPFFTTLAGLASFASTTCAADAVVSGRHRAVALERRATSVSPTAPGPGDIFRSGQACSITWTAGTSKKWNSMTIDLMTGANKDMVKLVNVATAVDGTSLTSYSWTCPEVDPNAPIYFYQFTDKSGANPTWTTRFTIASDNGNTVAAPNANQPEGDAIPWGTGQIISGGSSTTSSGSSSNSSSTNSTSSNSSKANTSSSSAKAASQSGNSSSGNSTTSTSNINTTSSGAGSISSTLPVGTTLFGVMAAVVSALLL